MPWRNTTYNRDTLYEEVWSEPMTTVAARYNVSSAALAKMCRRLNVPYPGRGYWAKKGAGKAVKKRGLPALKPGQPAQHVVDRWLDPVTSPAVSGADRERLIEQERVKETPVVAESLTDPHPLLAASLDAIRRLDVTASRPKWPRTPCVAILVRPELQERALLIMDAVLKACEARGYRADLRQLKEGEFGRERIGWATGVRVGENRVEFELEEDRFAVAATAIAETKEGEQTGNVPARKSVRHRVHRKLQAVGQLCLRITNSPEYYGQSEWKDTKRPLEWKLAAFIGGIAVTAECMRCRQAERDRVAEEARRAAAERRRREREKELVEDLGKRLGVLHEAQLTLQLALEVEKEIARVGTAEAPAADGRRGWVSWARRRADHLMRWATKVPSVVEDNG